MTLCIKAEEWSIWKAEVFDVAATGVIPAADLAIKIAALQSKFFPATDATSDLSASAAARNDPPVRCDASTQLWTVRTSYYSHYVLRKIAAERSRNRLYQMVGRLGAALQCMASDFIQFARVQGRGGLSTSDMEKSGIPSSSTANLIQWSSVSLPSAARGAQGGMSSSNHRHQSISNCNTSDDSCCCRWSGLHILSPATLGVLCSQFSEWRRYRKDQHAVERGDGSDTAPPGKHREELEFLAKQFATGPTPTLMTRSSRCMAESQTDEWLGGSHSIINAPFLCRQCRRDGRNTYAYDQKRQQLHHLQSADDFVRNDYSSQVLFPSTGKFVSVEHDSAARQSTSFLQPPQLWVSKELKGKKSINKSTSQTILPSISPAEHGNMT